MLHRFASHTIAEADRLNVKGKVENVHVLEMGHQGVWIAPKAYAVGLSVRKASMVRLLE
jgi:hypothetical protein